MFSIKTGVTLSLGTLTVLLPLAVTAAPIYEHYYVGIDSRGIIPTGTYAGLNNPNYNRLTFLFPHIEPDPTTNHFHGIGIYSYTGGVSNPTIVPTSSNNRLPEAFTGLPPVNLVPGTGIFSDRLITQTRDVEYSNNRIRPVQTLVEHSPDPATDFLFNSSGGRWQGLLGDATIALELVSLSPGLNIADENGINLFNGVGGSYILGQGDNFSFTPIFHTDRFAPVGQYSAEFRLLDVNDANGRSPLLPSGTFTLDFQVQNVPEPSAFLGLALLMGFFGWKKGKKNHD